MRRGRESRHSQAWRWLPGFGTKAQLTAFAVELIVADESLIVAEQAALAGDQLFDECADRWIMSGEIP